MKKVAKILFLIALPIVIALLSFESVAFDTDLFLKKINDYGVYEKLNQEQVDAQVVNLIDYLRNGEDLIQEFYSAKELLHLKDVKNIFTVINIAAYFFYIIFIIILYYLRKNLSRTDFFKHLILGGVISFSFYILLLLLLMSSFDRMFYLLHETLFINDYWLLNPEYENLVTIFPGQFFADIGKLIFAKTIVISLLTIFLSFSFVKFGRKK